MDNRNWSRRIAQKSVIALEGSDSSEMLYACLHFIFHPFRHSEVYAGTKASFKP